MEARMKKMDRYVTVTATLYREMDELSVMESGLSKSLKWKEKESTICDLQQKLFWQRQEVKYLKERSLWNRTFESGFGHPLVLKGVAVATPVFFLFEKYIFLKNNKKFN
jgi:hypothetical protein